MLCRGRQRNLQRFITHVHNHCTAHYNIFCLAMFSLPLPSSTWFRKLRIHGVDVNLQWSVQPLWLVVNCARKFKTEKQPIRDATRISVELHHRYGIFGSSLRRLSSEGRIETAKWGGSLFSGPCGLLVILSAAVKHMASRVKFKTLNHRA